MRTSTTRLLLLLTAALRTCSCREGGARPPAAVRCGEVPAAIFGCLGNPMLVPASVASQCKSSSECERLTCTLSNAGWLSAAGAVDGAAAGRYFERYAAEHPAWGAAAARARADCLGAAGAALPPQGALLACPAYDLLHCALTAFLKGAPAQAWRGGAACEAARAYAESCPVCPEECFARAIPVGSCNACRQPPAASPSPSP